MEWLLSLQAQKNYKSYKRMERYFGKYISQYWVRFQRKVQRK